jgi:hypothetical protein
VYISTGMRRGLEAHRPSELALYPQRGRRLTAIVVEPTTKTVSNKQHIRDNHNSRRPR